MSPPKTRMLVLGIDAASPALLERWAETGALPTLQALIGRGAVGRTRGVAGFFIGSTWPSFSTGVGPAGHGVHYLAQLRPESYEYERIADRPEPVPPFWVALSRAGRRVAVLDVPLSRLASGLNGVQTVEWGAHDSLFGFQAAPGELAHEILSTVGRHPLSGGCDGARRRAAEVESFVDILVRGAALKGELTRNVLSRGGWDLVVQVFTEAHCAGHQCWHLHDTEHPNHDARIRAAVGDPLLRVYQAIDTAVGGLLDEAGEALVIVLAAHGMSHQYGAQFLLPELLVRLGVAEPLPPAPGPGLPRSVARRLWRTLPTEARYRLEPLVRPLRPDAPHDELPRHSVDPQRSACFPVANGLPVGGLRLNLIGREPEGVLAPGPEADRFCETLAADLGAVVDADTGRPLVRRVVRTRDLYRGPRVDDLPDLLVEWSDEGPVGNAVLGPAEAAVVRATSDRIGRLEGVNGWGRTGEHRSDGLVAVAGPGVTGGRLDEVGLLDLAPTILSRLGVDPRGLDGSPIDA